MLCIIDYGIGNLRSIEKALEAVGADVIRSDKPEDIARAERIVLPGVGAFGACSNEIKHRNLIDPIKDAADSGKPFLGVCVGLQLLFDHSNEMGIHEGLGIIPGHITRFSHTYAKETVLQESTQGSTDFEEEISSEVLKVPHMGWNTIQPERSSPLLSGLPDPAYFYFVHSYHAVPSHSSDVLASTVYGTSFPAIVQRNNVFGVQFHPEKSHNNGLHILQNFAGIPTVSPTHVL